ncbi:MAG: hypothetical protein ACYDHU_09765 [Acidimicrobiales bacterium]
MTFTVLVKAAPVLTRDLKESMCVAGARVSDNRAEWVRLHPVPFRDLDDGQKFAKYQRVTLNVRRSNTDRRPETWSPAPGAKISLGDSLGTDGGTWAHRRQLVGQLREASMCELVEANRSGSGPDTPSLALVRPLEPPELKITARDEEQIREWQRRAEGVASRVSLFEDPETRKPDFEVVPWRFRYHYKCSSAGCGGHEQTIIDWEIVALWRNVRRRSNWRELMCQKFERDLWAGRETALFVGNQEQRPWGFLVLGVFYPPDVPPQGVMVL